MGRGRAPCCDKSKVKKGPWSPAEDFRLISFIHKHGHANWRALPKQAGLLRCGKSCRLRWINYLRPDVKRGNFTPEEEETIIKLHNSMGNKWSKIASHFPGRTDNEIKNVWNTHLKKRLMKRDAGSSHENETKSSSTSHSANSSSSASTNSIMSYEDKNKEKGLEKTEKQSVIDSPSSSFVSDFSSLSQVEIPRPKEDTICSTHNFSTDEAFEIPSETDLEAFWSVLDTVDLSKCSTPSQSLEHEDCQGSHLMEEKDFDPAVECKKWLKNLEYELGLLEDQCDADNQKKNMMLQPEIDNRVDCFPVWPSSPQSFGI